MYKIFVVDDETDLVEVIKSYLEKENFQVDIFTDGQSALDAVDIGADLWLLDIMLGGDISGYDIIKKIKTQNPKPVIFMSARDKEFDRVMGLELGSDDYITKPFSMREMVLRVKNVLKRNHIETKIFNLGKYTIDEQKRSITKGENQISLTSKELDLVLLLAANSGISFTRDKLLIKVWGEDYFGSDRVVDDLIKRIRKKMPGLNIETIYGYGYRLT